MPSTKRLETGGVPSVELPEIPNWLPQPIIDALATSEFDKLPKLVGQVPFGERVPVQSSVEKILGKRVIEDPPVKTTDIKVPEDARKRLGQVEASWRRRLGIDPSLPEDISVIGETAKKTGLTVGERGGNPAMAALTAILASPGPAVKTAIEISGPGDLLRPEILNPVLARRNNAGILAKAMSQLPEEKRQQGFNLFLEEALLYARSNPGKSPRLVVSRAIAAMMAADDSVDDESAAPRDRAYRHVAGAINALEEIEPGYLSIISRSLPTPALIELGLTGELGSGNLLTLMRGYSNELERTKFRNDGRFGLRRSRSGARRFAAEEIAGKEEAEIAARFSAAVIRAAAQETTAQGVIDKLVKDGSDYVIENIIRLARAGDEDERTAALELLRMNPVTHDVAVKIGGGAED